MNNYIEVKGVGKSINEAIEDALSKAVAELGKSRDEVTFELISQGKAGFLGLGGISAKFKVYYETGSGDRALKFLEGLFGLMKVDATAEAKEDEPGRLSISLKGGDMGLLIGRRGETLDALQYITNLAVNKGEEKYTRVSIDTENYREKRADALERLAKRVAEKVQKTKRSTTLEPMSPHERRIIHACLQNVANISTFSTGQDPNRRVVVSYSSGEAKPSGEKPGGEKTAGEKPVGQKPRQGGGGGGGARRPGGQNRNGGRPRNNNQKPAPKPAETADTGESGEE